MSRSINITVCYTKECLFLNPSVLKTLSDPGNVLMQPHILKCEVRRHIRSVVMQSWCPKKKKRLEHACMMHSTFLALAV